MRTRNLVGFSFHIRVSEKKYNCVSPISSKFSSSRCGNEEKFWSFYEKIFSREFSRKFVHSENQVQFGYWKKMCEFDFFWFYEWSTKKYWDQKCLDWMWWITDHFISYLNIVNLSYASKTRILSYQNNDSFSYCYSYRLFHFIILFCQ